MTHRPSARALPLLALGALLGACWGPATPEPAAAPGAPPAPSATPAPAAVPSAQAAAPAASGLPDLRAGLATGLCEEIRGTNVPGADSYFFGELVVDGSAARGSETWELHANSAWKARGGGDCVIEWRLVGSKVAPKACQECDFGLSLSSTPLVEKSGCVEDLKKREARAEQLAYDVKLQTDGTALVYFAGSGKLLGEGHHKDGTVQFRSAHQCKWF
ncbi:MAG: hypothetical protein JNM72_06490 [Deltaproteobacteria bacterium]|nr:hypothetical protein [Deltaproteobacteria bacterium]